MKQRSRINKNTKPMKLPAKCEAGFLKELDKRSVTFAQLNTAYREVMSDMGGQEGLSHVQVCLAERFCFLEFVLRGIELKIAQNPDDSTLLLGRWIQGLNSLSGLSKTIGLERRAKKVVNLKEYVAEQKKKKQKRL